jgi:hypothetical protein
MTVVMSDAMEASRLCQIRARRLLLMLVSKTNADRLARKSLGHSALSVSLQWSLYYSWSFS